LKRNAAATFIVITVLLDVLALGLVIPVLPKLISGMVEDDPVKAAATYSIFVTSWEAMQFVFAPILGAMSDRFGRRPIVLLSNFGLGLDYLLMALAHTLPLLFIGRVVSGITSATFSVAGAYIADVTPEEKRAQAFGMLGAAFGIGFVAGPALGGLLGGFGPRTPFFVAGALSIMNAIYGYWVLPESLPASARTALSLRAMNPFATLSILWRNSTLRSLGFTQLVSNVAHFVYQSVFVLYTGYRFHWTPRDVGLCLAAVGVCGAIVQGGLVGPIVAKLGPYRAALLGFVFGAAGFTVMGVAKTSAVFMCAVPLNSLWGLSEPALSGVMSREVSASEQGRLQGANASLMAFAGIFAPTMFSRIYVWGIHPTDRLGLTQLFSRETLLGAPFFVSVTLLFLCAILTLARAEAAPPVTSADQPSGDAETPKTST
jgi:MFS transporter, DHA1 family, tetracycline resistance protein